MDLNGLEFEILQRVMFEQAGLGKGELTKKQKQEVEQIFHGVVLVVDAGLVLQDQ